MSNQAPLHEPKLADVLARAVGSILGSIHTAFPGIVETYDYATAKASIKPVVGRRYADGAEIDMPIIPSVPVVWLRTSAGSISFPLSRGDGVLVICAERSIDDFLSAAAGATVIPEDGRKFDLSDAIAIPGLYPFGVTTLIDNATDFQIKFKEKSIFIRDNGDVEIDAGNKIIVRDNGDIEVGGSDLKKLVNDEFKTLFNNHGHDYLGDYGAAAVTGCPVNGITATSPPTPITDTHLTSKVKAQ